MQPLNPFGRYTFPEFNECDKDAINTLVKSKKSLFAHDINKHSKENIEDQLSIYTDYGNSPKDFLNVATLLNYTYAKKSYENHILNPFSNPKSIQKRYTTHFFPISKALLHSQEEMKLRSLFIKMLCDNNCFDGRARFITKNRQIVIKTYDRQRKLHFLTGICSSALFAESLVQCKDPKLTQKALEIFKTLFKASINELPNDEEVKAEKENEHNLNVIGKMRTVAKDIQDQIICPIGLDGLNKAVNLYPCNHKINDEYIKEYIGPIPRNGKCEAAQVKCLICATPIKGVAIDHTVRQIANSIEDLAKLLFAAKPNSESIKNAIEHLEDQASCPINAEFLTTAINLHPCAHKINDEYLPQLVGKIAEDGSCEKENTPCPICAVPIQAIGKDHIMRQIAESVELLSKLLNELN